MATMRRSMAAAVTALAVAALGPLVIGSSSQASGSTQGAASAVSDDEITETVRAIARSLEQADPSAGFIISTKAQNGQIVVELPNRGKGMGKQRSAIAVPAAGYGGNVTIETIAQAPQSAACRGDYCDPPLRGGVEISRSGTSCSSGFVARSRSDSKRYLLTAGHCGAGNWSTRTSAGTPRQIGPMHARVFARRGDYGIVAVRDNRYWRATGLVFNRAGADTTRNEAYRIRGVGRSSVGMRICKSAATTGTTCGRVYQLNSTVRYEGGPTVEGLTEANLCARPGDSGGAVLASNRAYGMISGIVPNTCRTYYQEVGPAARDLNVRVQTR